MGDSAPGSGSALSRLAIILFGAAVAAIGYKPLEKKFGPTLAPYRAKIEHFLSWTPPPVKEGGKTSDASSSSRGVEAPVGPVMAKTPPKKPVDRITKDDKKDLQRVLDNL